MSRITPAIVRVALFLVLWNLGGTAGAADLYTATVPVADRSEEARKVALRAALGQVLIKLSGDPSAARWAMSQGGLEDAPNHVDRETYLMRDRRPDPNDPSQNFLGRELLLQARFSPSFVDPLQRRLDLPLWTARRDPVLVWLAAEGPERERDLVEEDEAFWRTALDRAAESRGLELIHPVLDADDRRAVDTAAVWGALWEDLEPAAERYGTQVIVAVRLSGRGGLWEARWSLSDHGDTSSWTSRGSDGYDALYSGFSSAADILGERYAVRAGEFRQSRVSAMLSGISTVADYGRVMQFLNGHSLVDDVELKRTGDDGIIVTLNLNAAVDSFLASLERSAVLRPVADAAVDFSEQRPATELWLELYR